MMLGGGAVTMLTGKSGYVFLFEGEKSNVLTAYHEWELAVWREQDGARQVEAIDFETLEAGTSVSFPTSGLSVKVETRMENADGFLKTDKPADAGLESTSKIVELRERKLELEPERNLPALVATVTRAGSSLTRRLLLYGADEKAAEWKEGDVSWRIQLQRRREELPISIGLADFKREVHPNTETPKSFASRVEVTFPNGVERGVEIEMNKPFRHEGYTFYQASFSETASTQGSKFAVTQNYGRLLPYVATTITTLGLVIHFGMQLLRMARERRRTA
jgi:hypothetical protein